MFDRSTLLVTGGTGSFGHDVLRKCQVRAASALPATILGGAGSLDDIARLIRTCGVIGAAAGSLFVFEGAYRAVLINYPTQAQKEALIGSALTESDCR